MKEVKVMLPFVMTLLEEEVLIVREIVTQRGQVELTLLQEMEQIHHQLISLLIISNSNLFKVDQTLETTIKGKCLVATLHLNLIQL
jgi:hypothetical protein